MNNGYRILQGIVTLSVIIFCGCATRADIARLDSSNKDLKSSLDRIEIYTENTPNQINYDVFDVTRGKSVGFLTSDTHISVGERIFLNDDIWDVKYVKIFTVQTKADTDGTPKFRTVNIQLLVTFGGKATDLADKK